MLTIILPFLLSLIPHLPDPALALAQDCADSGQYAEAVTEYKRFIFFHNDSLDSCIGDAYYRMGLALRNCGRFPESLDAFDNSLQRAAGRWSTDAKKIAKAVSLTALGRFSEAEFTLLRMEVASNTEGTRKTCILFRGINSLYGQRWDKAREALKSFVDISSTSLEDGPVREAIQRFLVGANNLHPKSASLAKVFSMVLPGSGQLYAHDFTGGANAMALNGIFGYLLIHDLVTGNYIQAALSSFFLFKRFYLGNIRNAARAANLYTDTMNKRLALDFLNELHADHER